MPPSVPNAEPTAKPAPTFNANSAPVAVGSVAYIKPSCAAVSAPTDAPVRSACMPILAPPVKGIAIRFIGSKREAPSCCPKDA